MTASSEEMGEIVAKFVTNHKLVDKHLALAYRASLKMAKDAEDGIKGGMIAKGLEAKGFLAKHRELPGLIAHAADFAADLHIAGTDIATANGVDVGTIDNVGGVPFPQPDFHTEGGGGR